jgi:hypothetical protein
MTLSWRWGTGWRCTNFEVNRTNIQWVTLPATPSVSSGDLLPDSGWRQLTWGLTWQLRLGLIVERRVQDSLLRTSHTVRCKSSCGSETPGVWNLGSWGDRVTKEDGMVKMVSSVGVYRLLSGIIWQEKLSNRRALFWTEKSPSENTWGVWWWGYRPILCCPGTLDFPLPVFVSKMKPRWSKCGDPALPLFKLMNSVCLLWMNE